MLKLSAGWKTVTQNKEPDMKHNQEPVGLVALTDDELIAVVGGGKLDIALKIATFIAGAFGAGYAAGKASKG